MSKRSSKWAKAVLFGWLFVLFLSLNADAQKRASRRKSTAPKKPAAVVNLPAVKLIDDARLKELLVPKGKPLLINFWATWCDPCREEFPDLVKLDAEYKGKIDFLTISLDDPADIAGSVPKFLAQMKAEMPAFLLKTPDESAVISFVSKDWHGGMPFTILFDPRGTTVYSIQGKVKLPLIHTELDKLLAAESK